MRRPQFSIKTLLWLMAVVAAFVGGAGWQRRQYQADREHWEWRDQNFSDLVRALQKERDSLAASQAPR
jgi:hypothetical protein